MEGDDDNNSDIIIHRNSRGSGSHGRFFSSSCALVELSLLESMCLRGGGWFSGNPFAFLFFRQCVLIELTLNLIWTRISPSRTLKEAPTVKLMRWCGWGCGGKGGKKKCWK